jgi:hypothetical protein
MTSEAIERIWLARERQLSEALDAANAELKLWREGGVTEELLRKNNGFIRLGKGCAIVRANEVEGGAQ